MGWILKWGFGLGEGEPAGFFYVAYEVVGVETNYGVGHDTYDLSHSFCVY